MKKRHFIIACTLFSFGTLAVFGQYGIHSDGSGGYLERGRLMYENHNYVGCIDQLTQLKRMTSDYSMNEIADYFIAAATYERGKEESVEMLVRFVNKYPSSAYVPEANFKVGNYYFFEGKYGLAIRTYSGLDVDKLPESLQADYCYRLAYSYLKEESYLQAKPLFEVLSRSSDKYKEASDFYLAYILYAEGDYARAMQGFAKSSGSREFGTESRYYMTQIYFLQKNYAQVISLGKELLGGNTGKEFGAELNRLVGESSYFEGKNSDALSYLGRYVSMTPRPMRNSLYMLGVEEYRENRYSEAIAYLSRVTDKDDALMQNAYLYIAQSYLKLGDKKNARLSFETASRYNYDQQVKETALYNYALSIHETAFSPFDESVGVFERFLNEFPASRYADKINDYLVEVYMTTKNYKSALVSIEKIKRPDAKILAAKQRILFQLGTEAFTNARLADAKSYFKRAIDMGNYVPETRAQAWFWIGECNYRQNNYAQAEQDYKNYLSLTKQKNTHLYSLARYDLAYTCFKQHKFSEALSHFNSYVSGSDKSDKSMLADAYNRIGDCYYYARRFADAERYYGESQNILPGNGDYALFQKGFMAGLQKNYQVKLDLMDKLIATYPQSEYIDDALFEKGQAYTIMGNDKEAIRVYQKLLKDYPQSSISRKGGLQLGMVYFNSGMIDESIDAYKQVISAYPSSDEARVATEDLKSVYVEKNDVSSYASYIKSLGGTITYKVSELDSLSYLAAERSYAAQKNISGLTKYIQEFPQGAFLSQAHYYIAADAFNKKDYGTALLSFNYVLEHQPDGNFAEEALARKSEILYLQNDMDNALENFRLLEKKATTTENRRASRLGIIRISQNQQKPWGVLEAANSLLQDAKLSPELRQEALFARAAAYKAVDKPDKAIADWKVLASDPRTIYGAESAYLLSQHYYDTNNLDMAEKQLNNFIDQGTSHQYWLARGFLLMADIFIKRGDNFQAKQYLSSLKNNYTVQDDIAGRIQERLSKIGE